MRVVGVCMVCNSDDFHWYMHGLQFACVLLVFIWCTIRVILFGVYMVCNSGEFDWCMHGLHFV